MSQAKGTILVLGALVAALLGVVPALGLSGKFAGSKSVPAVQVAQATQIYYLEGGIQRGPMSMDELKSLIGMGVVKPETLVWQNGMADWARADGVAELAAAFAPATTTTEVQYYVYEDNKQIGPLTLADVLARTAGGETLPEELVWKTGGDWVRADALAELAGSFWQDNGDEYTLNEAGQQLGPFTRAEVVKRMAALETRGEDKVWRTGLTQWTLIRNLARTEDSARGGAIAGHRLVTGNTITLPANLTTPADLKKYEMLVGALFGVLFHEFGHAIIGEIEIPATGPEEDTVDEFSALLLSEAIKPSNFAADAASDREFVLEVARYAALLWKHVADMEAKAGGSTPWYDEHSDSANRFGNMLCMIYGADPQSFAALADTVELPERQRQICTLELPKRLKAWRTITAPYRRDNGDYPESPGMQPSNAKGAAITVDFEPSTTATGQALLPLFQSIGFEEIVKGFHEGFRLAARLPAGLCRLRRGQCLLRSGWRSRHHVLGRHRILRRRDPRCRGRRAELKDARVLHYMFERTMARAPTARPIAAMTAATRVP